ncbi:zinc finger, C2H2 type [Necator americanus]|uniref:Zinc finger, C2H2 type n=1 Tax=Necator americanus TaxID=51031 RepID=W2T5Q9_NECAM|nr:zinc finger, C2H2 type [Necator americanus]ETN76531.1 zinc finger, C2H2 type [Necator americanus]
MCLDEEYLLEDDDEELDVESTVGGSSSNMDAFKLFEVPGRKSMHVCPFEGCQYRYARGEEMEYHKATAHAKRAVMYEAICCQTDISAFRRRSVQTDVEGLVPEVPPCPSTAEGSVKQEKPASTSSGTETKVEDPQPSKSPAGYSDISDDGVAPQLQKEEPTNDVRAPLLISTALPTSSASGPANILTSPEFASSPREREPVPESLPSTPQQPKVSRPSSMPVAPATPTALQSSFQPVSVPVTPAPTGMYMSSFAHQMMSPFTPTQLGATPTANPAPSPQQQPLNKLPQSHMKPSDDVTPSSGVLSAGKTMQSPAAQNMQRQFGLQMMQSGTGQHQAAMMQAAAAQAQMAQMHHLYMQQMAAGARGAQFPMAGTSAGAHEMAQLVALQALQQQQQQSHFANMFQQK